jgi:hypothetical protein
MHCQHHFSISGMTSMLLELRTGARRGAISVDSDYQVSAGTVIGRDRYFDRRRLHVSEGMVVALTQAALSRSLQQVA